jgi:hypothetical protein
MFPDLEPLTVDDAALQELADAMTDADPASTAGNNANVPAGFTYLGQFVDHDVTLDLTAIGEKESDPTAVENFRTPALDLDSVYGLGPDGSRHLYARNAGDPGGKNPGTKLLVGKNINVAAGGVTGDHRNDLPRGPEGFALVGDHRNDENLVVAQTHIAFLKFHNKVCDTLSASGLAPEAIFAEARRLVTWHYQWLVLHDWVERITQKGIVATILDHGREFYRFKRTPFMPVEFSAAAYRLGHSMVREAYSHNRIFTQGGLAPATLALLFRFTGLSGGIVGELAPNPPTAPTPISVLPSNWIIDWRRFRSGAAESCGRGVQSVAQDRSVRRADAAHAAGRRREPSVPQPEARRDARTAVGTVGRQGDEDSQSADARRNRDRTRWSRRQKAPAARADAALVLHPERSRAARQRRAPWSCGRDDRL